MNIKKRVLCGLMSLAIVAAIPVVALAANSSESIDGSRASWYGGISSGKIYSKVWDHVVDGRRYTVTVWAQDDNGHKDSVRGTTNGVNADGQVIVTKTATYNHLFVHNKCGYKNVSYVD